MFGSTETGAVRMEKIMMALSSAFEAFGKVVKAVLVNGFKSYILCYDLRV